MKSVKEKKKKNLIMSDLIGPTIAVENIVILIFYFWWNFIDKNKPNFMSYILAYLLVLIAIVLIIVCICSLVNLVANYTKVSKNVKRDRITFSVVGIILGLIMLLFTDTVASSIGTFKEPVKACDNSVVREIGVGIGG